MMIMGEWILILKKTTRSLGISFPKLFYIDCLVVQHVFALEVVCIDKAEAIGVLMYIYIIIICLIVLEKM